jgi:hypothetical protein
MASAYFTYAGAAIFGGSAPTIAPALRAAMGATLLGAIATPAGGSPAALAAAWSSAVATFWTAVPVTGGQTGATVGCPGAPGLVASLTGVYSNTGNTAAGCAQQTATALDAATKTVTAAVAPPPGTILPIA